MKRIIIALILLSTVSAKASLVSHWAFDETNGATAFNSVSGTNGTINLVGFVDEGKIGNAYEFDQLNNATNAYVEMVGYKGILGTASRTVNIWLKTPARATTNDVELIYWGSDGDGKYWKHELLADGRVRIRIYNGDVWSISTVTNDIWRMFTVVSQDDGSPDISEVKVYIDGITNRFSHQTKGINTEARDDVMVGRGYTGLLDDPAIWDEGLTTNEITCLYDAADQLGYNAHHFDQLKQLHDASTGSAQPLDEWWEYASDLTGSPGLNISGSSKWLIFNGAAGTGVRLVASSGTIFRTK